MSIVKKLAAAGACALLACAFVPASAMAATSLGESLNISAAKNAIELSETGTTTITVGANKIAWVKYTMPTNNRRAYFWSSDMATDVEDARPDVAAWLYTEDTKNKKQLNFLNYDDDGAGNLNFYVANKLKRGSTCYLAIKGINNKIPQSFTLHYGVVSDNDITQYPIATDCGNLFADTGVTASIVEPFVTVYKYNGDAYIRPQVDFEGWYACAEDGTPGEIVSTNTKAPDKPGTYYLGVSARGYTGLAYTKVELLDPYDINCKSYECYGAIYREDLTKPMTFDEIKDQLHPYMLPYYMGDAPEKTFTVTSDNLEFVNWIRIFDEEEIHEDENGHVSYFEVVGTDPNNAPASTNCVTVRGTGKFSGQRQYEFDIAEKYNLRSLNCANSSYSGASKTFKWGETLTAAEMTEFIKLYYPGTSPNEFDQNTVLDPSNYEAVAFHKTNTSKSPAETKGYAQITKGGDYYLEVRGAKGTKFEGTVNYYYVTVYAETPAGTLLECTSGNDAGIYRVTKCDTENDVFECELVKSTVTGKVVDTCDWIRLSDGNGYYITSIGANALKGNTNITKVWIGGSIKSIGANAFKGCKNLKTIEIYSPDLSLSNVGSNAFKGISGNAVLKTRTKTKAAYKNLLIKRGAPKTIKVTRI